MSRRGNLAQRAGVAGQQLQARFFLEQEGGDVYPGLGLYILKWPLDIQKLSFSSTRISFSWPSVTLTRFPRFPSTDIAARFAQVPIVIAAEAYMTEQDDRSSGGRRADPPSSPARP